MSSKLRDMAERLQQAPNVSEQMAKLDQMLAVGYDDYWKGRQPTKSPFADLPNISGSREAGAVTAAAFLSAFVDYPWAHLDIAGSAFKGSTPKGGTGRPVGLLLEFFRNKVA